MWQNTKASKNVKDHQSFKRKVKECKVHGRYYRENERILKTFFKKATKEEELNRLDIDGTESEFVDFINTAKFQDNIDTAYTHLKEKHTKLRYNSLKTNKVFQVELLNPFLSPSTKIFQ